MKKIRIVVAVLVLLGIFLVIYKKIDENKKQDVYQGYLEATKIKISSQASGTITSFPVKEGDIISKNKIIAIIEGDKLQTKRQQNLLQIRSMALNLDSTRAQIEQISAQLAFQKDTLAKTGLLLAQGAATKQNNDDLKTQVTILQAKLEEANSRYAMIRNEREQLLSALSFLDLQIKDTIIRAPQDGTILNKYYEQGEVIQPGMVLVDLADLRSLDARIYLPLSRIPSIKIGQEVRIKTDGIKESLKGKITWIASEAEFTPKTILTKETRTTLVYAVKVTVENPDGKLKMGMPVEVDNLTQR